MPARTDIDPVALDAALPILWLCDYEADTERFRCRLAGEKISELHGGPIAGRYVDEILQGDRTSEMMGRYRRVVGEPAIGHAAGRVYLHKDGRLVGERILLPLATDGEKADGVLGATSFRWPIGILPGDARGELLRLTFTPL